MENIEQRVKKIVAEQLGVNEADVKNESSFVNDLGADSLDTVELVMALEEEFETEIPDEEAEKITTVQQAIDYIKSHSPRSPEPGPTGAICPGAESSSPDSASSARSATRSAKPGRTSSPARSGITRITRFDASAFRVARSRAR